MNILRALSRPVTAGFRTASQHRLFSNTLPAMASSAAPSAGNGESKSSNGSSLLPKSFLITPADLATALNASSPTSPSPSISTRVIPLCASWFLPNDPQARTGASVFAASRIPHARFFDLDAVKDPESPYPHMLPTAEDFAAAMGELGIERRDAVVVYDSAELGIFSAPRVAWTLRVFGHERVHVLNNYRLWVEGGYPVETGEPERAGQAWQKTKYPVPGFKSEKVIAFREVKEINKRKKEGEKEDVQVVDLRSKGRFDGTAPEPRPGLSSGHMPGSINLPLPELLDPKTGAYLPVEQLRAIFEAKGINPKKPIVSTCGTGVMAAACDVAFSEAGFGQPGDRRVYDGSWTEYAQRVNGADGLIEKNE